MIRSQQPKGKKKKRKKEKKKKKKKKDSQILFITFRIRTKPNAMGGNCEQSILHPIRHPKLLESDRDRTALHQNRPSPVDIAIG